jgi:hypothetical protein
VERCLARYYKCDGYKDCADGADEDPAMCSQKRQGGDL